MTNISRDEPVFQISVVARMVGIHQQTLRTYERMGLVQPHRTPGNRRLYSHHDVAQLNQLRRLIEDLGVNLAGAEVILRLNSQIEELHESRETLASQLDELRNELRRLRERLGMPEEEQT